MKHFAFATFALIILAGCQDEKAEATIEISPAGIEYARLYIPDTKDISIQVAWPSSWALNEGVNQAVPYIGAELILAGGAEGFAAGEVVETFADLKANAKMWVTADHLHGNLVVPKENLEEAAKIAAAHLAKPAMDQGWFDRIQQGFATNMAEIKSQPAMRGYDALRWAILGDTPLRRALSVDPPEMIDSASRADVLEWHKQIVTRTGPKIVIAGDLDQDAAGKVIDVLISGLPAATAASIKKPIANFAPRRILLRVPDAKTTNLVFMGPLPPTREGSEFEDVLLATALGGDDKSVLFDAVRTGLRASYGFSAGLDGYSRDLRMIILTGEVETQKLQQAEEIVRMSYSEFLAAPTMGDLNERKAPFKANSEQSAKDPASASFAALMAMLDGMHPSLALTLPAILDKVTDETIKNRAVLAFPKGQNLSVLAVSPEIDALAGACVITAPEEAVKCP